MLQALIMGEESENNILHGPLTVRKICRSGIGVFIYEACKKFEGKLSQVVSETGEEETFGSLNKRITSASVELIKRGVATNDIVAICAGVSIHNAVVFSATTYIGAIFLPLDPALSVLRVTNLLNLMKPKILFVGLESVCLVEKAFSHLKFRMEIIVLGSNSKYTTFSEFQKPAHDEHFKPAEIDGDNATAAIFGGSGTSGATKGICISHSTLLKTTETWINFGCNFERILTHSSLYWYDDVALLLASFWTGGATILFQGVNFDPNTMIKIIRDYKVTTTYVDPSMAIKLTESVSSPYNTSSFQTMMITGSRLYAKQLTNIQRVLPHTIIVVVYGLTEAGFCTSNLLLTHPDTSNKRIDSCGTVLGNMKLKVVDIATERALGPNQRGEIRVKGDTLFNGYYRASVPDIFDDQGWLKTGDLGYYDEDHYFYMCDRIKDTFKYDGWTILPSEIEQILVQHNSVKEAVVTGIPTCGGIELPSALVVLKENCPSIIEDIVAFVNERVADHEQLRGGLKIVEKLPKTPTGKVSRKAVRDLYFTTETL